MGTATGEALAIGVAELVQTDRVSDKTRLAHGHSIAKPHTASRKELVSAIEEKHQQYEARGSQRWRALDRLLCTSFATISPAYLFNSYLDID